MHRPLHALAVKDRGRSLRGRGKRREVREGALGQGREDSVEAKGRFGPPAEMPTKRAGSAYRRAKPDGGRASRTRCEE